jgi:hypothetical protein
MTSMLQLAATGCKLSREQHVQTYQWYSGSLGEFLNFLKFFELFSTFFAVGQIDENWISVTILSNMK